MLGRESLAMARYVDANLAPIYLNETACEQIKMMPTADVVEMKHGEWIDNIQKFTSPAGVTKDYLVGYKCSVCGRTESRKEPYCNCGAKMDGRRDT